MDCEHTAGEIKTWLTYQLESTRQKGFVVGVSGGIDSALVSTLCAQTGHPTILVTIPIHQNTERSDKHMLWLTEQYPNATKFEVNLSRVMDRFEYELWPNVFDYNKHGDLAQTELVSANLQSRLRMCALYAFANASDFLVVGTGNKVEDFGIGFCTKGGDSMVDISPIGDLLKSEVRELAAYLGVAEDIVTAAPTDGLWADGRTDEDQIGATYDELEWAMERYDAFICNFDEILAKSSYTQRQLEVLRIYHKRHQANEHKMKMPPLGPLAVYPYCGATYQLYKS
jgi:NAD+ synthase